MPAKVDSKPDLALPAAMLEFGQAIASAHPGARINPRTGATADPQRLADAEDRLLAMVKADAAARKAMGIRAARQEESESRVRLRVFALMAYRSLAQPAIEPVSQISDIALACMDRRLPPGEAVLRARGILGAMVVADEIIGSGEAEGAIEKARLPMHALE